MIKRPYDEQQIYGADPHFTDWKERAAEAHAKVCAAVRSGSKPAFDAEIWRDLKKYLLAYFDGNCAYCETNVSAGFWGDVEHYRPKRKVEGSDPAHPGYYWLAYEPRNLMPSCQRCNQAGGKMNQFPVADGVYWRNEADENQEKPLLLNPYLDSPFEHLEFTFDEANGAPTGYVGARTDKGSQSIEIYKLNRSDLVDFRRQMQNDSIDMCAGILSRRDRDTLNQLERFLDGLRKRDFAAARIAAVKTWIKWRNASVERLVADE